MSRGLQDRLHYSRFLPIRFPYPLLAPFIHEIGGYFFVLALVVFLKPGTNT
jgi:hypothetical protein